MVKRYRIKNAIFVIVILFSIRLFSQDSQQKIPKGKLLNAPIAATSSIKMEMQTILFSETFESGANNWNKTNSWSIGSPSSDPFSGYNSNKCAGTNLTGNYPNNANDWLISPAITLPVLNGATQITLSFFEWYQIESDYDKGMVKISTDNGSTWSAILSTRSGNSPWRFTDLNITSFAGRTVKIAFQLTSDNVGNFPGWYIDNISVTKDDPKFFEVALPSINPQNFPFIYMNVTVDTNGHGCSVLRQENFKVYENGVLQNNYFNVSPPDSSGGVRLTDIIFIIDNTGSMSTEISSVRNNVTMFVDSLSKSGIDYRLGLITFKDDVSIVNNGALINNVATYKSWIAGLTANGGGDDPENSFGAMAYAISNFSFRPGSQKVFILITDADAQVPPAPSHVIPVPPSQSQLIEQLNANKITCYAAAISTGQWKGSGSVTQATNGKYFDVTSPFNSILNEIAARVSDTYVISYKSDNPASSGDVREVKVIAERGSWVDTASGVYIPSSGPVIVRTTKTQDYHKQAWAENTSFSIEAQITDDIAPTVSYATLFYRKTGSATFSTINMSRSGNIYIGLIPASIVKTPGIEYYITATDGNSMSTDPRVNAATYPYQIAVLPNKAPEISHTPVTKLVTGVAIPLSATVIDVTNSLTAVKLFYRKIGQLLYTESTMNKTSGDLFEATIPAVAVTKEGLEYYIYAVDNFGVASTKGTADIPYTIEPEYDLKFRPNPHGWQFANSENYMWPSSWWSRFNYGASPYPLGWPYWPINARSEDFPDWPLFVETFGESRCYWSPPPGVIIYSPTAVKRWRNLVNGNKSRDINGVLHPWSGSCFGLASTSIGIFDKVFAFPGGENLFSQACTDNNRRFINRLFLFQFGEVQLNYMYANMGKSPVATLDEFKYLCLHSLKNGQDRTISLLNQLGGGGGHTIVPYKIEKDPANANIEYIYVYDNNSPNNETRRISIDKALKRWNYPALDWGGSSGLYLEEPIINYLNIPILAKDNGNPKSFRTLAAANMEIYLSPGSSYLLKNSSGDSLSYQNALLIDNLKNCIPIIPKNGQSSSPIGYYLAPDNYQISFSSAGDSSLYLSIYTDSSSIHIARPNNRVTQTDVIRIKGERSFTIASNDTSLKEYTAQLITQSVSEERLFSAENVAMHKSDSCGFALMSDGSILVKNYGAPKQYNLELRQVSKTAEEVFQHKKISIAADRYQYVVPKWQDLKNEPVKILNDLDGDGAVDDSIKVHNEYTGETPPTGGKLANDAVYFYPNPYNPKNGQGTFRYSLQSAGLVTIKILDVANNLVKTVIQGEYRPEKTELSDMWDGRNESSQTVANGVYFYIIESNAGERAMGKIAIIR